MAARPLFGMVTAALLAMAVSAHSQGFTGQSGDENAPLAFGPGPTPTQPMPAQPRPPQPAPAQPVPMQGPGGAGPSLLGAWSGQHFDATGNIRQSDYFAPDGSFVSAAQLASGQMIRAWGTYRPTQIGQNQLRVDLQIQGWLPRQICRQFPGMNPVCTPFQLPTMDTVLVTFFSPTAFQSVSQTLPGAAITETRDPNPALLQIQVPQQMVINMPAPAYAPPPAPAPGYTPPPVGYRPSPPATPRCDDLQQRRICAINDGHLVPSGGCLVCVSP